jgi:glycosyltransferase involved in cell wall biosynthesis
MLFAHADIFDRPPGTYDPLVTRWYRHVTPIAYREADRTLAVSGYIRNAAVRNGAAAHQARVVPNGIDIDELAPASASMACDTRATANRFVIVYVGRLAPEKGVADLIAAAALLKERQVDFTLRLVGDGPLRSELERMVDSLRLGFAVEFVGSLDRSALADCYSSAHVTCVPSISEPQGLVVLESLICGTPVVGSAVGGIPDMIVDGVNGRLVAPSSPVQLADALQNLALDRVGWRKLQSASAQSVRDRWSWDVIGDRLEAEITELLSAA